MNLTFLIILSFVSTSFAKNTKSCSKENFEILLDLSANALGVLGHASTETTHLLDGTSNRHLTLGEIRTKFSTIQKETADQMNPLDVQISEFVKRHPECDKKFNFSKKIN